MSGNRGGKVLSPRSYPALVVQAVAPHFAFQRLKVVGFEKRDVESHVIVSGTDSDSGRLAELFRLGIFLGELGDLLEKLRRFGTFWVNMEVLSFGNVQKRPASLRLAPISPFSAWMSGNAVSELWTSETRTLYQRSRETCLICSAL